MMRRKYPPPRKIQVLFYKFDKKIALKRFLNFHILSSKNLATNPTKTPPLHTPHRLLHKPPKETVFATNLKTKKDFTNVKDFFHYFRIRTNVGSWAKNREARGRICVFRGVAYLTYVSPKKNQMMPESVSLVVNLFTKKGVLANAFSHF